MVNLHFPYNEVPDYGNAAVFDLENPDDEDELQVVVDKERREAVFRRFLRSAGSEGAEEDPDGKKITRS